MTEKYSRATQPTYRGGILTRTRIDKEIADYRADGFDAKTQLKAMDREGLDVAALYPLIGLGIMMRDDMDPKLAAAIARAYNNWLYDFCQTDPKRLKGVAMMPLQDPNEAVKEAERVVGSWVSSVFSRDLSRCATCRGMRAISTPCGRAWKSSAFPSASIPPRLRRSATDRRSIW